MSFARRAVIILAAALLLALSSCRASEPEPAAPAPETPSPALTPPPTPAPSPTPEPPPAPTPTPSPTPEPPPAPTPTPSPTPEPTPKPLPAEVADEEFVLVTDYIPSIYVELKYATEDNFTGGVIYDFTQAYLRCGTVKKLAAAQETLLEQGYSLLIWDAYRPRSAQFALWEVCPDPVYVANPVTGNSSHSRGNTVDVTLVTAEGEAMEMPTGFDDFSALADRDYSDVSDAARENALLLESTMTQAGFEPYQGEWWHYSDSVKYDVS